MLKGDMCIFSNVQQFIHTEKSVNRFGDYEGGEFYILHVVYEFNLKRIVIIIQSIYKPLR